MLRPGLRPTADDDSGARADRSRLGKSWLGGGGGACGWECAAGNSSRDRGAGPEPEPGDLNGLTFDPALRDLPRDLLVNRMPTRVRRRVARQSQLARSRTRASLPRGRDLSLIHISEPTRQA